MFSVIYSCLLPTWVISFYSLPTTATNEILQKSKSSSLLSDHDLVWTGLPNHMLTEKYLDTGHYQTIDRGIPQVKYQQKHVANPPSHHHSQKKIETSKPSHSKMDNEQPSLGFDSQTSLHWWDPPRFGSSGCCINNEPRLQVMYPNTSEIRPFWVVPLPRMPITSRIILYVFFAGDPYMNLHLVTVTGSGAEPKEYLRKTYQKPIHTVDGSEIRLTTWDVKTR